MMAMTTRRVRRIITTLAEKKYFDISVGSFNMTAAWVFDSLLDGIQIGQLATNRIGNKICVEKIEVHVLMSPLTTLNAEGCMCRLVLYHNKETVGALPVSANVFTTDTVSSTRNMVLKPRVTIKKDMTHTMVATGSNAGSTISVGPMGMMSFTIYPKKVIDFQSSTPSIVDLFKDDFGIGWIASAASSCKMQYTAQVVFTDM